MRWKWGKRLNSLSDSSEKAVVLDNKKLAGKINNNNNNVVSLIFLMAVIFKTLKHNTPSSAEFWNFCGDGMNGTRGQNTCDGEYNATQTSRRCLRCQSTTTTTKVAKEKITTSEQDNVFFQTDWLSYSIATRKMFPLCVLLPFSSFNYFHVWVVAGCWDWVPHRVMRSRPRWFVHWTARQPVSLLPRRKSFHLFSIIIIIIQEKKQIHLISYHFIGYYYSDEKNGDIARRINWLVLADSQKMAKLAKFKFLLLFLPTCITIHISQVNLSRLSIRRRTKVSPFFFFFFAGDGGSPDLWRVVYAEGYINTDIDRQTDRRAIYCVHNRDTASIIEKK